MRNMILVVLLLLVSLSIVFSSQAYVYYVEAENYDPDTSVINAAGCIWTLTENEDMSNEHYMKYSGAHVGANTSLFYTLPKIDNPAQCKVWFLCLMPDGGANSYFVYVSTDGGGKWGPQQTISAAETPDWKWLEWTPITPFEKGEGNVIRVAEREDANLDLVCVRNDGVVPSIDEYLVWMEEWEAKQMAVEPFHKATTTWGSIRSAF